MTSRIPERLVPPATKPHISVFRVARAWYVLALSQALRDRPLPVTLLGTPLVLFRTRSGRAATLLDRCPHRNVPLSAGRVVGEHLQCGYHGWELDADGACKTVPGLIEALAPDGRGRRALALPTREQDGFVWVWGDPESAPGPDDRPFTFPALGSDEGYTVVRREVAARGSLHATIENALDVPHTAFLHGGLFRTQTTRNPIRAELARHRTHVVCEYIGEPRPSGLVGRVLSPSGGIVEHFDRFFLPSIAQVEYRIGDENHFVVTSACTPVGDFETRLFALVQFRTRFPGVLVKLVLDPIARRIFAQDARMLALQTDVVRRFGGEQFESTDVDLMGPQIYRLMKDAAEGRTPGSHLATPAEAPAFTRSIELLA